MSAAHFPDELYGVTIEGIELSILSLDSARLVDAYVKQGAELSEIQLKVLHSCNEELRKVLPHLEGNALKHFQWLQEVVEDVLQKIQQQGL